MSSPPDSHSLKQLRTRQNKLKSEIKRIEEEIAEAQKDRQDKQAKLKDVNRIIELATKTPLVSEHGLLRYLQFKYNLDLKQEAQEVLSPQTIEIIKQCGSGKYPINNTGLKATVKDNVVVSVGPARKPDGKPKAIQEPQKLVVNF
jgi:hypothetical protein